MCAHDGEVIDDFGTGDSVCLLCGLVLDRLLGWVGDGPGGVFRHVKRNAGGDGYNSASPSAASRYFNALETSPTEKEIMHALSILQLDCDTNVSQALSIYHRVYGAEDEHRHRSQSKQKLAVAFAIFRTLAEIGSPRPPEYVASICGLENARQLIRAEDILRGSGSCRGSSSSSSSSSSDDESIYSPPQDYVDTVCAELSIPFSKATEIRDEAERMEWVLYGRTPTVITAASIQKQLADEGTLTPQLRAAICDLLNCGQRAVDRAVADWRRYLRR